MRTLMLALSLLLVSASSVSAEQKMAPGFEAVAVKTDGTLGEKVSLDQLKGKMVVVEWTNPDCPYVKRHYRSQTMTKLAEKYGNQDVQWVAVNSTATFKPAALAEWMKEHNVQYPVLDDRAGTIGHAYGAKTTPHMFVIDKTGALAYQGAIDDDSSGDEESPKNYVSQALDELLAGKPVSTPETKPYGCSVKYAS